MGGTIQIHKEKVVVMVIHETMDQQVIEKMIQRLETVLDKPLCKIDNSIVSMFAKRIPVFSSSAWCVNAYDQFSEMIETTSAIIHAHLPSDCEFVYAIILDKVAYKAPQCRVETFAECLFVTKDDDKWDKYDSYVSRQRIDAAFVCMMHDSNKSEPGLVAIPDRGNNLQFIGYISRN